MPASTPRWPSEAGPAARPRPGLRGDSQAVTEVIGYLLVFGILAFVLVLSMLAFNLAQDAARERAVVLRAESAAARVAGVVVQTAILAEQQEGSATVAYSVDLPDDLEGLAYTVHIEAATATAPDQVRVLVPALDIDVTAPVFSASAPADVEICDSDVAGGGLLVRFDAKPAGCGVATAKAIFLGAA